MGTESVGSDNSVVAVTRQFGPYRVTDAADGGWWVVYVESQEDINAWEDMITRVPRLGSAYETEPEIRIEVDTGEGPECLVLGHWK